MLAFETQRRLEFFYDIWLNSDEAIPIFTPEIIDSYVPDFEFITWACDQDAHGTLWDRIQQVMRTVPGPPRVMAGDSDDDDADSDDMDEDDAPDGA